MDSEPQEEKKTEWKLYTRRWFMLAIFFCFSLGNSFQWIQYSIIANVVRKYYDVESLAIDWTSMIFMVVFILFIFPASLLLDKVGMRWPMLIGTFLTSLGACIKLASVQRHLFWVTFVGQTSVALGQLFMLSVPPAFAAIWFGEKEVSTACAIATIGNQMGIVLGFLLPPTLVHDHENIDDIGEDLMVVFIISAVFNTVIFLVTILFFQARPPTPPSPQQAKIKENASENTEGFWSLLGRLARHKSFMLAVSAYSINQGVVNALSTLLNQLILHYFKDGETFAGYAGVVSVCSGMTGGFVFGLLLDRTRRYKLITLIIYAASLAALVAFTYSLTSRIEALVYTANTFLGFFIGGYMPVAYDFTIEITYPEPEGVTAGFLTFASQLVSTIFTFAYGELVRSIGPEWSNLILCFTLLVGTVLHIIMNPELKRQAAKGNNTNEETKEHD